MSNTTAAARMAGVVAAAILLLTGAQKCDTTTSGGSSGAGSQGDCTFTDVQTPSTLQAPGQSGSWITGTVTVACDPMPTSSRLLLRLEKRKGTRWVAVWTEPPNMRIPNPGGSRFAASFPGCQTGTWRLHVTISGTTAGGTPYRVDDSSSSTAITC